jgi:hypothetical protein
MILIVSLQMARMMKKCKSEFLNVEIVLPPPHGGVLKQPRDGETSA